MIHSLFVHSPVVAEEDMKVDEGDGCRFDNEDGETYRSFIIQYISN
jgi:hypothetical protein